MILSKQLLQREARLTGYRIEHLEKVFLLMDLLSDFATFPQLKNKIVLKGGTALNLFFSDLPRLSVDIDLNYIGSIDKDTMLAERPVIQSTVEAICERNGLILNRNHYNNIIIIVDSLPPRSHTLIVLIMSLIITLLPNVAA